jgi:hypothetical protein
MSCYFEHRHPTCSLDEFIIHLKSLQAQQPDVKLQVAFSDGYRVFGYDKLEDVVWVEKDVVCIGNLENVNKECNIVYKDNGDGNHETTCGDVPNCTFNVDGDQEN